MSCDDTQPTWVSDADDILTFIEGKRAWQECGGMTGRDRLFDRAMTDSHMAKLRDHARLSGCLADVLGASDLMIGLRGNRIDVYYQGQALFRFAVDVMETAPLRVDTHEKYLVDPDLKSRVRLNGTKFETTELFEKAFTQTYEGPATIEKMKRAAAYYAGDEKKGCHEVMKHNACVIDCEIAFPDFADVGGVPVKSGRLDLVTIVPDGDQARLQFWEAKLFGNKDLRADTRRVEAVAPVVGQVRRYQTWISANHKRLEDVYQRVAHNLVDLADAGWIRKPTETIRKVASGEMPLVCGPDPEKTVGLLIFGFDTDQKLGRTWSPHRRHLYEVGISVISAGDAKKIRLA